MFLAKIMDYPQLSTKLMCIFILSVTVISREKFVGEDKSCRCRAIRVLCIGDFDVIY